MEDTLELVTYPELFFGLVAPVGVDLELITEVLSQALQGMEYDSSIVRLTQLMREAIPAEEPPTTNSLIQSYKNRIAGANNTRRLLGNAALSAIAITAIRSHRSAFWTEESPGGFAGDPPSETSSSSVDKGPEDLPIPKHAYIIRQLKRPEEIHFLRSVYGPQFIVLSIFSPEDARIRRLADKEIEASGGLICDSVALTRAFSLIAQDASESQDANGQNVRDAFPLGDVFIDGSSKSTAEVTIRRFIHLLFGDNEITPSRDEYGMYLAKSASLRSSDLSRQVGAAIFRPSGEVASLGCNEVPKASGGTYWSGDRIDERDFRKGRDPNERKKFELLVDVLDRLNRSGYLAPQLGDQSDPYLLARQIIDADEQEIIKDSKLMDLLEFGRVIHAEMSAISDAARKGVALEGGTLYCTTFPCHMCAKHIVASGIMRVVYLEPYPKSYAHDLHGDSISLEASTEKVSFMSFIGVSPYRYRNLFEKGKRKYSGGLAQRWNRGIKRPMMELYYQSYFVAENIISAKLTKDIEQLSYSTASSPDMGSGTTSTI